MCRSVSVSGVAVACLLVLQVAWLCSGEEEVEDLFEDFDFSARFFDCNEGDFQDKYVHSCCVHMHMINREFGVDHYYVLDLVQG